MRGHGTPVAVGMVLLSGLIIVVGVGAVIRQQRLRPVRVEKLRRATERWEDEGGALSDGAAERGAPR